MEFPKCIARTRILKENVFGILIAVLTPIPLLIVGPAGCSKTLSFTIVDDNMRGEDSKSAFFQQLPVLRSMRYQCSEQSTDAEIKTVYQNASYAQKQQQQQQRQLNSNVVYVVFMDEAGLTPEEEMPLKAIHYELDQCEVASVLLSNKVLDPRQWSNQQPDTESIKSGARALMSHVFVSRLAHVSGPAGSGKPKKPTSSRKS
jgi:hypothetical protein